MDHGPLFLFQVEVEVESMDKAGNFIGWLHIDGVNLSVALVENALSKVHFTAERSSYYKTLVSAEEGCRQRKEKVGLTRTSLSTLGHLKLPELSLYPHIYLTVTDFGYQQDNI